MCFFGPLEGMEEMLQGLRSEGVWHREPDGVIGNTMRTCQKLMNIACHATKARLT